MSQQPANDTEFGYISADRGVILPAYSGVALLLSWIYLLFYANSAGIEAAAPVSLMGIPYTLSSLLMSVAVLVIAFGPADLPEKIMTGKMKVASSLGTSVGTLLMVGLSEPDVMWLTLAGAAVTGVFSGILAQQWVVAYRRVGLKATIGSFPALLAVSVGICMTAMYLPRVAVLVVTALLPIVSGFMLHSVRKSLFPEFDLEAPVKDRPLDFLIVIFPIGIFAFASGFLDYFSYQSGYTYFFYTTVTVVLLVTACVFIVVSNRENAFTCMVVPLCFMVCVFVPFLTMVDHVPASHFISIGELGIEIALFSIAVGFADFFSISALKTYALCRVVHFALNAVGWYAGCFSNSALNDMMNSQASLAVVFIGVEVIAVCLIVAIVKAQKTLPQNVGKVGANAQADAGPMAASSGNAARGLPGDGLALSGLGEGGAAAAREAVEYAAAGGEAGMAGSASIAGANDVSSFEVDLYSIGKEHGLSNREMDVFALLARGYSAAAIQSELYIAAGTVNYHTRNIYSKLNVHSKQELIGMVNAHRRR